MIEPSQTLEVKANLTDPNGRIMKGGDPRGQDVMLETLELTLEAAGIKDRPRVVLADAGSWSEANSKPVHVQRVRSYSSPSRKTGKNARRRGKEDAPEGACSETWTRVNVWNAGCSPKEDDVQIATGHHDKTSVGTGEGRRRLPTVYETGTTGCPD